MRWMREYLQPRTREDGNDNSECAEDEEMVDVTVILKDEGEEVVEDEEEERRMEEEKGLGVYRVVFTHSQHLCDVSLKASTVVFSICAEWRRSFASPDSGNVCVY
jgi:hypothetical protein